MNPFFKRKPILFFAIPITIFLIVIMTGLYPVALVEGSPIWRRQWLKAEVAEKKLTNTQAKSFGFKPVNFTVSGNQDLLRVLKRDTLTALIEDKIISVEGKKIIENFEDLSQKRLMDTLQSGGADFNQAVRTVYNLSLKDFKNLVLLPQARRDVLRVFLASEGKNFEEWLKETKHRKEVKLFLVPFRWAGEEIK